MNTKSHMQSWKRLATLAGALAVLVLQGCAVPTAYQPHAYTGGYSERRITDDMYEVMFSGNGNTPKATVERYFLYRCAELTKEKGYRYFAVLRTAVPAPPPGPAAPPPPPAPGVPSTPPGPSGANTGPGGYRHAALTATDLRSGGLLQVRGGGGGGGRGGRGGGYYYVPGGTYYGNRYVGHATIRMFNDNTLPGTIVGYPVAQVMQEIGPFIKDRMAMVGIPRPSLIDPKEGILPLPMRPPVPPAEGNGPAKEPGTPPADPGQPGSPGNQGGPPTTNDKAT